MPVWKTNSQRPKPLAYFGVSLLKMSDSDIQGLINEAKEALLKANTMPVRPAADKRLASHTLADLAKNVGLSPEEYKILFG